MVVIMMPESRRSITVDFEAWLAEPSESPASQSDHSFRAVRVDSETSSSACNHKSHPASPPRSDADTDEASADGDMASFIEASLLDDLVLDVLLDKDAEARQSSPDVVIAPTREGGRTGVKRAAAASEHDDTRRAARRTAPAKAAVLGDGAKGDATEPPASFLCNFPGCDRRYACKDAVRKHCRKHHPEWLRGLGKASVARTA